LCKTKLSGAAVLIDSALLRASGQGKKLNTVDLTHPALVRAVLQKNSIVLFPNTKDNSKVIFNGYFKKKLLWAKDLNP